MTALGTEIGGIADPRLGRGLARRAVAEVRSTARPAVLRRLHGLAEEVDASLAPRVSVRLLPAARVARDRLMIDGTELHGGWVNRLDGATEVAVVFATLGPEFAERAAARFTHGNAVEGLLFDQIGSAAVEHLGRRIEAGLRIAARSQGRRAGSPLHPGGPGLPLAVQPVLAEIGDAAAAGIRVVSGGLLSPIKSLSMVVGIGTGLKRWTRTSACLACPSFARCRNVGPKAERC